ncbi:MAG: DNA topoisomerase [Planctomyces sp.]|nr:DNA topoisomerase [Planctomyces sp.]
MSTGVSLTERSEQRAKQAGLIYINEYERGITRRRCGRGFTYIGANGRTITSEKTRSRIDSLVIPPPWEAVWICSSPRGHMQARGRDEAGRIQYIYHEEWQTYSATAKFDRLEEVADLLPRIRRRVRQDLNRDKLDERRVLAAVVRLLDKAQLRVGGQQAVEARGATTLQSKDVALEGMRVSLDFPSKSGQRREVEFSDAKVADVISQCEELNGQFLFNYLDEQGEIRCIDSTQVNEYLYDVAREEITSKDFRTWWGSVTAFSVLVEIYTDDPEADPQKACREAVKASAAVLGNTVAVCRKSYIHPGIFAAAESGKFPRLSRNLPTESRTELTIPETQFQSVLPRL